MRDPYFEGITAGEQDADTRSCPWEGTKNVNDWLTGYDVGQDRRREAEKQKKSTPR